MSEPKPDPLGAPTDDELRAMVEYWNQIIGMITGEIRSDKKTVDARSPTDAGAPAGFRRLPRRVVL
jgi:hypothetical protein